MQEFNEKIPYDQDYYDDPAWGFYEVKKQEEEKKLLTNFCYL